MKEPFPKVKSCVLYLSTRGWQLVISVGNAIFVVLEGGSDSRIAMIFVAINSQVPLSISVFSLYTSL
jgi:hypothetical protein